MRPWAMRAALVAVTPEFWGWVLLGSVALVTALLVATSCSAPQTCRYDARFDGRIADPGRGVFPYYLVAECPGAPTTTIIEAATPLHVPR